MPRWRFLLALLAIQCFSITPSQAVEICELDANDVPPVCENVDAYSVFPAAPQGGCPEGSRPQLLCDTFSPPTIPAAQMICRSEGDIIECFASPNGLNIPLNYNWTSSSSRVNIFSSGADAWLSCDLDVNAIITVHISDEYGRSTSTQKVVFCRKPRPGIQPK